MTLAASPAQNAGAPVVEPERLSWRLARIGAFFWRFGALRWGRRLFRSVKPGTLVARPLFGFSFVGDVSREGPERVLYLVGERYIDELALIQPLLKPGQHAVDVGTNIGYYSLMFARCLGEAGRITAIEPSVENLPELRANIERNNLSDRVTIIDCAVGDKPSKVGLKAGINSGIAAGDEAAYTVRLDTLDNLVSGPVDFLKMDIEGYELFALEGARKLIEAYQPTLFIEVHPSHIRALRSGPAMRGVVAFLGERYGNLKVYDQHPSMSRLRKVFNQYLGLPQYREVHDLEAFLDLMDARENPRPFWVICRPDRP